MRVGIVNEIITHTAATSFEESPLLEEEEAVTGLVYTIHSDGSIVDHREFSSVSLDEREMSITISLFFVWDISKTCCKTWEISGVCCL